MAASQGISTASRQQPPWKAPPQPPSDADIPPLVVWNSLTRTKTPFYPLDWKNKTVSVYACGVTPYDDAHLGHIRNYTTLDIVVRILRDFFKFKVRLVMNVTDVDDKIILRARQRHLLDLFKAGQLQVDSRRAPQEFQNVALDALAQYIEANLSNVPVAEQTTDIHKRVALIHAAVEHEVVDASSVGMEKQAKKKMHTRTVFGASQALKELGRGAKASQQDSISLDDVLMPFLDSKATIDATDHSIFSKVSRKYETRFWEDLQSMNCIPVTEVTRVTEYVPQIVDFISRIMGNGYAYKTSDGSVYFDIAAFEKDNNQYPRLEPWSRNDAGLQADGEGALSKTSSEKRGNSDFALWKSSKAGEPAWPSPWGNGRPGWHIECSAMASDKLGRQFDIHSGGIDLAFPHHDNELAQSEAYWAEKSNSHQHQWVNYFLHMGHLSIAGAKMSKSLKNFTTIRDALSRQEWTPRGLRVIFLLGGWRDGIEIGKGLVQEGSAWEDKLNNFFLKAKDVAQRTGSIDGSTNGTGISPLVKELEDAKTTTFEALCDSFNTAKVMHTISELITSANASESPDPATVIDIARWITSLVNILGLNEGAGPDDVEIGWSGLDIPAASKPLLLALSGMRDRLRTVARSQSKLHREDLQPILDDSKYQDIALGESPQELRSVLTNFRDRVSSLSDSKEMPKELLQICDRLRDVDLWNQKIYLEDRDGDQPALVRPVTRELMIAKQEKEEQERQKLQAKLDREREAATKAEKGRLSHLEIFKTSEYSAWDEEGLPTKDGNGEEVTKSRAKKLRKDWEKQKKLHETWLKTNS